MGMLICQERRESYYVRRKWTFGTQLVESEVGNLRVTSSSLALETGGNESPIHPVAKWVPVYGQGWHHS